MDDEALVLDVIARHPLASLVTHDGASPEVDLIPLLAQRTASGIELVGHVARVNRVWQVGRHEGESLAVFRATDHYISPTWYPSKAEHHRTVPTWNYVAVHAWGPLEVHDDPRWVRAGMAPARVRGRDAGPRRRHPQTRAADDREVQGLGAHERSRPARSP